MVIKQHYVPSLLLQHFADDNGGLFETDVLKHKVYRTCPKKAMFSKYTYEYSDLPENFLENQFREMEGYTATVITQIISYLEAEDINSVKRLIFRNLRLFLILYYRSGALLCEFANMRMFDKIPLLLNKILNARYIQLLSEMIINHYNFAIIHSDDDFYISDQCVSTAALKIKSRFAGISNRHMGLKDTIMLIPISASYYCVFWHCSARLFLTADKVNFLNGVEKNIINFSIYKNSYHKCCSRKDNLSQFVPSNYYSQLPSNLYVGYESGQVNSFIEKKEVFLFPIDEEAYKIYDYGTFTQFRSLGRNDLCGCGSGKKFKQCHLEKYLRIKDAIHSIRFQKEIDPAIYRIPGVKVLEQPIASW